jgi:phosphoenolpyruvate carboxykinase (GTP)
MKKFPTNHKPLKDWVNKMVRLCQPDDIVWVDGSSQQKEKLEKEAIELGEIIRLDQQKMPGCFLHRTAINDVARTEGLTFICTKKKHDAGPNNNWMSPQNAYRKARKIFKGSMRGRTMYVIPFSMGPVGSAFSKIGVELTDSRYVVLNMLIMTRAGEGVLRQLEKEETFTKCLHSKAELDINRRLILHFPEDNTIWSVGSGYGGNVLLGKKCLSLRIASFVARKEAWLAEHMLIMGIEEPNGRIDYIAAAFPSACGVGDDIAWMRVDSDGRLWAINPETGFFGVAPGTNSKTNPSMVETFRKSTIFTNVLLKPDYTVWWEGADGEVPASGIDWQGRSWRPGNRDQDGKLILGAHPNSRFTAPIANCPSASFRQEQPHGVPISAIIFGGRRAHLAPLVYESLNWQHGVFVGATMASELTAAQFGKIGKVRRDPMAMKPFCGYNMAEYFRHWLAMGKRMVKPPKIFHVNWFRTDKKGKILWPGFGENLRVLQWILDRCHEKAGAVKTFIGLLPQATDIDLNGLSFTPGALEELLALDEEAWQEEIKEIKNFFKMFKKDLPDELWQEYESLRARLKASQQ